MRLENHPILLKITDTMGLTDPVERYKREMDEWHARAVQPKIDRTRDLFLQTLQDHIRNGTTPQTGIASYILAKHSHDPSTLYNGYTITPRSSDWRVAEPTPSDYLLGTDELSLEGYGAASDVSQPFTAPTIEIHEGQIVERTGGIGWSGERPVERSAPTRRLSSEHLNHASGE